MRHIDGWLEIVMYIEFLNMSKNILFYVMDKNFHQWIIIPLIVDK